MTTPNVRVMGLTNYEKGRRAYSARYCLALLARFLEYIYFSLFYHVILGLNTRSQHMCDATEFPVVLLRHTKIYCTDLQNVTGDRIRLG